jgi:hypothetical protein
MKSSFMPPISLALCMTGMLAFSSCKDTVFNTKNGKLINKEGSGDGKGSGSGIPGDTNGDGIVNDEDQNNTGKKLSNDEDINNKGKKGKNGKNGGDDDDTLNGGKNGADGDDTDKPNKSRRNRPALGLLNALNNAGGDTPLALDWNQDGVFKTTFAATGHKVLFDMSGAGTSTPVEWLKPEDRWLALDLNHNGKIDDASELFGSSTSLLGNLPLSLKASNGFEALTQYDTNQDGLINRFDSVFAKLLLWEDKNSNGISEPSELTPLADTAVESLSVNAVALDPSKERLEKSSAYIGYQASYLIKQNGQMKRYRLVDIYFPNLYKTLSQN